MRMRLSTGVALPALVIALVATAAHAQTSAEDKAAADAAYKKGKELQDQQQCGEAIAYFAKSQELDPQNGTQYNLALCHEELGHVASAWALYDELSAKDTKKARKADAAKRAKKLAPKLTRMAITVAAPTGGLVILRDGVDVTALVGVETPVDPVVSQLEASAPGRVTWRAEVDLTAPGETVTIEIPELALLPEKVEDPGHDEIVVEMPKPAPGKPGKTRKIVGLTLASLGVVAVGVGGYFGFVAMGLTDDAKTECGGALDPCFGSIDVAQGYVDDARTNATLSNVFIGAGVATAVLGVVLWVTAPDGAPPERSAAVVPMGDGMGVTLDGRW